MAEDRRKESGGGATQLAVEGSAIQQIKQSDPTEQAVDLTQKEEERWVGLQGETLYKIGRNDTLKEEARAIKQHEG